MKKGLLTLLAASLVFVGCQNYDDQFDDLNAQISALKSQVDGLSSLSGQVSSLSSTISGLQAGVAAAQAAATAAGASADAATAAVGAISIPETDLSGLETSLAALAADVAEVQAQIATAATASAVAALQVELDALEADLDDLLVSNNVYATDITITDAASMASALALGNKVALMNATVTITDATTVSDTDLQTFIDRIKTMNGNFVYSSGSATGYAPTFDQMVSAKAITLTTAGDISFKALTSATTITINDDYESKITSVDFGALTSLTSFTNDDSAANTINLTNATNVDLASLTRHTSLVGSPFTIITKEGATVDLSSLDDVSTAGKQEDLFLSLNGAASYTSANHAGGEITLTNVATATVSGLYGTLDVNAGVETLTVTDGVRVELDGATDLVTATLDFALDYDPDLTTANATIAAGGYSDDYTQDYDVNEIAFDDLETLTITGDLLDLYIDGTELVTLSIDATMHDLTITNATDLTTLTVAEGSKIGNISLAGTTNLKVADFNHTSNLTDVDKTAQKSVTFSATNNTALEKLHSTGDDVDTLTITGNTSLAELDFTGLADDGAETTASDGGVTIWGNALVAVSASNTSDGDTDKDAGLATDLGSFDDGTSGMDTLKTYLTHIAATTNSVAFVTFDTVQTETDTETSGTTTTTLNIADAGDGSTTNKATVLKMTAAAASNAVADKAAIAAKRLFHPKAATTKLMFKKASGFIPAGESHTTAYTLTGNNEIDAIQFASTANKDLATALGFTLSAHNKGNSYGTVSLISQPIGASTVNGERYTTSTALSTAATSAKGAGTNTTLFSTSLEDVFTLTVGDNTVSVSLGGTLGGSQTTTTLTDIEQAIKAAWGTKYGTSGTASAAAIATLLSVDDGIINIDALQVDSGGWGQSISFSVTDKSAVDSQTSDNIDYVIGLTKDSGDNSTIATANKTGLLIMLESNTAGTDLNAVSGVADAAQGASLQEITTNFRTNASTWTGKGLATGTTQERTDVRAAEGFVAGSANTAAAATVFTRVAWLG